MFGQNTFPPKKTQPTISHLHHETHQLMVRVGGLGPGGLDSDWIPENERDSGGIPIPIPNHRAPNQQLTFEREKNVYPIPNKYQ